MNKRVTPTLKSLQTLAAKYREEIKLKNNEAQTLQAEIKLKYDALKDIERQIKQKTEKVIVTEHAALRYLERVKGVDIDSLYKEILTDQLKEQISVIGDGEFPMPGFKVVVKDNKVVTVTKD